MRNVGASALALVAWALAWTSPGSATQASSAGEAPPSLASVAAEPNTRLVALERAHGVLIGALASGRGKVDEADVLRRMTRRMEAPAASAAPDAEADRGYAMLGPRGAEIVRRTHTFHREVLAIFVAVPAGDRRGALDAAVARYRSRPDVALSDVPKDMGVLYDHPYTSFVPPRPGTTEPRRALAYPSLTGAVWASHWYQLAVQDPLERFDDLAERQRALATVAERFERKLSAGTPPDAFPSELPLAPSIAPGLVAVHERSAAILDNLNIMLDVIADVLVHPSVVDRRAAVSEVIGQFTDPRFRCVPTEDWITVALRHSIFEQGGPALGTMKGNERNAFYGGHGQHYAGPRRVAPCELE